MSKVCRFNLRGGGVLEIAPNLISEITMDSYKAEFAVVALGVASHGIEHTLEEAQAIWDAAKEETVDPEDRESLRQAANAIGAAFDGKEEEPAPTGAFNERGRNRFDTVARKGDDQSPGRVDWTKSRGKRIRSGS